MLRAPDRRIKRRYLIVASDPEPELSSAGNLVQQTAAIISGNDFGNSTSAKPGQLHQATALDRDTPCRRAADIGVKNITIYCNDCVGEGGNRQSSQRRPPQCRRRKYP